MIRSWSWSGDRTVAPRSIEDVSIQLRQFHDLLNEILEYIKTDVASRHAFPAIVRIEAEIEGNPVLPIDRPENDDSEDAVPDADDPSHRLKEDALAADAELLEEIPLPGVPVTEQE